MTSSLVGVIVGGLIAIISGAIGPAIQHLLLDRTRKEQARQDNMHAIVIKLYQLDDWLERKRASFAFGEKHDVGVSPFATVEALVRVHFPDAKLQLAQINLAVSRCQTWAAARGQERLRGDKLDISGWLEVVQDYSIAKAHLIEAVTGSHLTDYAAAFAGKANEAEKATPPAPTNPAP